MLVGISMPLKKLVTYPKNDVGSQYFDDAFRYSFESKYLHIDIYVNHYKQTSNWRSQMQPLYVFLEPLSTD
jgi:hypothetical protein